jgi:hypothetical protein
MGERTQKVVLRDGQVLKYWSRWGGQSCVDELVAGFQGFADNLSFDRSETDWMDAVWAEGGYLVDFERKKILLYSWDRDYLEKVTPPYRKHGRVRQ